MMDMGKENFDGPNGVCAIVGRPIPDQQGNLQTKYIPTELREKPEL